MELKQILFNENGTLTEFGILYYKALKFNNFVLEYENIQRDVVKLETRVVDAIRDLIINLSLEDDPESANNSKHVLNLKASESDLNAIFVENGKVMVLIDKLDDDFVDLLTMDFDIAFDIFNQLLQMYSETH